MPIKEITYRCQYCHTSLRTYEICEEHEKCCKDEEEISQLYRVRLKEIFPNQYMFYAKSEEDVNKCIDYNGVATYRSNYDYQDFKYPCLVMMFTHTEYDTLDDCYEDYVTIVELNKFLKQLNNMKGECK